FAGAQLTGRPSWGILFMVRSNVRRHLEASKMVERMRRLRMSLASSSPGASGDIARPNYVGPSGNGLVERMKAGETPWNQGRSNGRPCPSPEGGPEDEGKRRSGAPRGETPYVIGRTPQGVDLLPAPFGAPLPSPSV